MKVDWDDYLDTEVMDQEGRLAGSLACFWRDEDDEPAFLGIHTRRPPEKTAVVPARIAEANERRSCVFLRITAADLRSAPSLDCDLELNEDFEKKVWDHFQLEPPPRRRTLHLFESHKSHSHGLR